ncbi:MAG: phage tail protein [Synechococcus sp. ELA619]
MTDVIRGAGFGGGGCFHGDTLISAPAGAIKIAEVKPGVIVYAFDDRGGIHECKVEKLHCHEREEVFRYKVWGGRELLATANHWVLNQYGAFVEIGTLGRDDCLVDDLGHLRPLLSAEVAGHFPVYNLSVAEHHTYFANGFRVHNAGLGHQNIIGSGGGGRKSKGSGGGQRTPSTADDNLNSTQSARILCLLGEGEQEGFPSGAGYVRGSTAYENAILKDIYLNQTPILKLAADPNNPQESDFNYKGVLIAHQDGTVDQGYLGGFQQSESDTAVGLIVLSGTPLTRTISDVSTNAVKVTLSWQALQQITDEGDIIGVEVKYLVQVANAGGGFNTIVDTSVSGRSGDTYQRTHEIPMTGPYPVDIRVVRVTPDATSEKIQDSMIWTSYSQVIYAKLSYPYSALLGIQIDARYFSSWPTISVKRRGIKVYIPSNATVDPVNGRLIYSGIWTGDFAAAQWTTDPAWILFDLVTSTRYGFGQQCEAAALDRWSFYSASQYCAELVPDGKGGYEPRFSCSVNIQNQSEGFDLINQLASVFMAMPYWSVNMMNISQDRPSLPVATFHNSDVEDGQFRYVGASLRSRHTVAVVKYFSNEIQDFLYEAVEDSDGISKYGSVTVNVDAFACTTRGQARRLGEWLLYTEQRESEVLTFASSLAAGSHVRPGHVISIMDDMKTGLRRGGKIIGGTTEHFVVDNTSKTDLPSGPDATATIMLADGTIETRSIASGIDGLASSGNWDVAMTLLIDQYCVPGGEIVAFTSSLGGLPLIGGTWCINDNLAKATLWRVISIDESDQAKYTVNAIRYNASKYNYIERNVPLDDTQFAPIEIGAPSSPSSTKAATSIDSNTNQTDLYLSWASVPGAVEYEVSYRTR